MSGTARPPLPTNFQLEISPAASPSVRGTLAPRSQTAPAQTTTRTANRSAPRRSMQLGRRAARALSGVLFGFNAPVTQRIARGIRGGRSNEAQYQNASAMDVLPPSMEAERVQETQNRATLGVISETLLRIENTVNGIAAGMGAGRASGGNEQASGGGGLLGMLGGLLGGLGAGAGLAGIGAVVRRLVGSVARAIFTRIPIIGPLILVALNIEGAMEEYERNGLGSAITELISGIGSDLTFGLVSRERIREIIENGVGQLREWWNSATEALSNLVSSIGDSLRGFFGWVNESLQSAYDNFQRRRAELEGRSIEGQQEAEQNRAAMTPGQRAGRGVGTSYVQMMRNRPGYLSEDQVEDVQNTLANAPPDETPEQRTQRESLRREFEGQGQLTPAIAEYMDARRTAAAAQAQTQAPVAASMQEELNFIPTPAVNNTPVPATSESTNTPAENTPQRAPSAYTNESTNESPSAVSAGETPTASPNQVPPQRVPAGQEAQQPIAPENFNVERYRQLDRQGATIFERRVTQRTNEIVNEIVEREQPRGQVARRNLINQSQAQAREQATREVLSEPAIVERISRAIPDVQRVTVPTPQPPAAQRANTSGVMPGMAPTQSIPSTQSTNDNVPSNTVPASEPNAPQQQMQSAPTANLAPAENAENLARTLSESAPGPTVIPIPVPQGGGQVQQGGGGGSAGGGGGATSARAPSAPPPVHPPRPAEYITPQVSGR